MLVPSKLNVVGILIDPATYETALQRIVQAAHEKRRFTVSALAVHGVMTGVLSREHKYRLNRFDLLVPDGQPVRWALNLLHRAKLKDRVYGPELTSRLCGEAAKEGLGIYLYGSTESILEGFRDVLQKRHPQIKISGAEPSRFRRLTVEEKEMLVARVRASGASMLFVGLGCPRQEVFAFELAESLSMPVLAVGAAFPFIAGQIPQAPPWMQKRGLEWLFRLGTEPRRLWRRYLYLNPLYVALVGLQAIGISQSPGNVNAPLVEELYG